MWNFIYFTRTHAHYINCRPLFRPSVLLVLFLISRSPLLLLLFIAVAVTVVLAVLVVAGLVQHESNSLLMRHRVPATWPKRPQALELVAWVGLRLYTQQMLYNFGVLKMRIYPIVVAFVCWVWKTNYWMLWNCIWKMSTPSGFSGLFSPPRQISANNPGQIRRTWKWLNYWVLCESLRPSSWPRGEREKSPHLSARARVELLNK